MNLKFKLTEKCGIIGIKLNPFYCIYAFGLGIYFI